MFRSMHCHYSLLLATSPKFRSYVTDLLIQCPKPTVGFSEMCFRVASGFKDSRQGPAQETMSKHFPGYVLVADPGLGVPPLLIRKDAEEGGVGSGECQSPSGNHLKENGCSCIALPSSGPCPPSASAACGAGKNGPWLLNRAE